MSGRDDKTKGEGRVHAVGSRPRPLESEAHGLYEEELVRATSKGVPCIPSMVPSKKRPPPWKRISGDGAPKPYGPSV